MLLPALVRGALFDLDGVLIDSARAWYETIRAGAARPGDLSFAAFLATFGQGPEADRREYFPSWTRDKVNQFYLEAFPRHLDQVALMPGARETLADLREHGIRLAIVTNTPRPLAEAVLRSKKLDTLIDTLAAAGDAAEKPAPDLILLALNSLHLATTEVIYVGDSASDLAAARAADVFMFGLEADGDATITELGELAQHLPAV